MPAKQTAAGGYANNLLSLIFNGTTYPGFAMNTTTSPLTSLYVSLHTSSPGAGGSQTTSEAAFTGYSRVAVTRTTAGWTVTGNAVSPAATISFPASTSGPETESFFGVGTTASGAGALLYYGSVSPVIIVNNGTTAQLTTASQISEV